MLISFVGCPCSGKTTTAASVFASLKTLGLPVEFIPEQARLYIAKKRFYQKLSPEEKLPLCNEDQVEIFMKQFYLEEVMTKVCGESMIIVTDSTPLNALLYMTPEKRQGAFVEGLIRDYKRQLSLTKSVLFHAMPTVGHNGFDPNRSHSEEQSKIIAADVDPLLKEFGFSAHVLSGSVEARRDTVLATSMQKYLSEDKC
jgi:hypothetical protein